jgi:cell division protein FtsL
MTEKDTNTWNESISQNKVTILLFGIAQFVAFAIFILNLQTKVVTLEEKIDYMKDDIKDLKRLVEKERDRSRWNNVR